MTSSTEAEAPRPPDRRQLRRESTKAEILHLAGEIMAQEGVAAMTMSKVARALQIKPPSLYKYYSSRDAIYDEIFKAGQHDNLRVLRSGMTGRPPGLAALAGGLEATARWAIQNPVTAQLLFWRPVPGFEPSAEAFAPTIELVDVIRTELRTAHLHGEIHADAATDDALALLSAMHFGVISQQLANEPGADWEHGRYTRQHAMVLPLFASAYPMPGGSGGVSPAAR